MTSTSGYEIYCHVFRHAPLDVGYPNPVFGQHDEMRRSHHKMHSNASQTTDMGEMMP